MGTNYYWHDVTTPFTPIHVGKSSGGWCFSLHVYPENNINDLEDWLKIFDNRMGYIRNEYGESVSRREMIDIITNRYGKNDWGTWNDRLSSYWYKNWKDFHRLNHSKPGPNGLLRHKTEEDEGGISDFCISNGTGTWDCIVGEFS